jgi:UDP-N-acetylmuramate--alanine ligase
VINAEDDFLSRYKNDAIRFYPSKEIKNIEYKLIDNEPYTKFSFRNWGEFEVWGLGEHIALNASAAMLAASKVLPISKIKQRLKDYKGIKKRFDILQKEKNFILIDDYAHHPTEIIATIKSAKIYQKMVNINKLTIIWQPHKYSRTIDNLDRFKECFKGCDRLIILPVWAVAEEPKEIDFEKEFSKYNLILADFIRTSKGKIDIIKDDKIVTVIDSGFVLGVGAGDITYQLR